MKWQNPFLRPAEYLVNRLSKLRGASGKHTKVDDEIRALSFGRASAVHAYHVKKAADMMLLGVVALAAAAVLLPFLLQETQAVPPEGLKRGDYGEGAIREEMLAEVEGESEVKELSFDLHQRTFTPDEAKELLELAKEELDQRLPGENPSRDEVRTKLDLPDTLQDGFVSVEYLMIPYGIVLEDGELSLPEDSDGELTEIKATLRCQEEELIYETAVMVLPPIANAKEQLMKALREQVAIEEEKGRTKPYFLMPDQVQGRKINWRFPGRNDAKFLLLLALIPLFLYVHRDEQIHTQAAQRTAQLAIDYPDLLWKLTMLLGAGLTIRSALLRIGAGYRTQLERGRTKKRYAYEELLYTLREMGSGIPEAQAYLNFGKRCALPGYLKLSTLLEQNLKKGSTGLAVMLETEAAQAMEGRINAARKQGEQAGTKLLFPMIMMLGVVLAILMVPALMVMG